MSTVIAAVDLGPSTSRILYHAAGFARLLSSTLRVVYAGHESDYDHVVAQCREALPYDVDPDEQQIVARNGRVADVILDEATQTNAALIVMGSRGLGRLATLLIGSVCEDVLRASTVPVLLVPSTDLDIVNISGTTTLSAGPVLAAIDLSEASERHVPIAESLAKIANQPLLLMTVAPAEVEEIDATNKLRVLAHACQQTKPHALIVRRGNVAEEISRCAVQEGSGLVVMGLRPAGRARPGMIASAVFRTRKAFVLAVPASA